jgi:hypothetical protein
VEEVLEAEDEVEKTLQAEYETCLCTCFSWKKHFRLKTRPSCVPASHGRSKMETEMSNILVPLFHGRNTGQKTGLLLYLLLMEEVLEAKCRLPFGIA